MLYGVFCIDASLFEHLHDTYPTWMELISQARVLYIYRIPLEEYRDPIPHVKLHNYTP